MDGTRSALIIATDQYTDPGLRRLRAPASDARALAAVLRDPGIGGFEVRTLLNEPAHVVNLAVEEFFADRRPGDLLLVHFSGHGVKDQDGELYLAATNTVLGRLGATAVAAEFVSRRMTRSRSRRVVLLLDCCYAGAFERGLVARAGTEVGIEQQFGGRGRAVITASSAMEYAFEAGELADARHLPPSVFTSALVQGLETGEADRDQDGLVGLDELYDYVYDQVRAATPNQTPGKWTFGVEGALYIARRSRPVTTPAPLPPELRHAIESPLAGVRAGAVQELAGVLRGSHAGMALAARLALEHLTEDDSRAVAAAAAAAAVLGAPAPVPPRLARPELVLSDAVIDLGRFPQHGLSPEQRVRISNAGGGDLNAQVAASASWLRLRQAGDELVVAVDTSAAGEYEGAVTVDSDGGTATVRVHAQVDPAPPPAPEAAAPTPAEPVPGTPDAVWPEPELLPGPEPVPDVAAAVAGPVPGVDGAAAADVPEPAHRGPKPARRWGRRHTEVATMTAAVLAVAGVLAAMLVNHPAGHSPSSAGSRTTTPTDASSTQLPTTPAKPSGPVSLVTRLTGPGRQRVASVAFGSGGKTLITADSDTNNYNLGSTYVWDIATRSRVASLSGIGGPVSANAFSGDGKTLATIGPGDSVLVWDIGTRRRIATQHQVLCPCEYSPDGKTLVSHEPNFYVIDLWNVATGAEIARLTEPDHIEVNTLEFSPDSKSLAMTADIDKGRMYLWDIANQTVTAVLTHEGITLAASTVYSADGKTIVNADFNGNTYLWDVSRQHLIGILPGPAGQGLRLAILSLDGKLLVTADDGGHVYLWNVATRRVITILSDPGGANVSSAEFSPDGKMFALGDDNGSTYLWRINA